MQGLAYKCRDMPTIKAFMDSDAYIRGLMGPFGGGKTSGCLWDIIQRGVKQKPGPDGVPRTRWAIVRQSYKQLEDSTIKTVVQWFPPALHGIYRSTGHDYTIRSLKADTSKPTDPRAEIELCFRALDRPDQVGNLLSTEYTGAWVNEGRDVPWAIFDALLGRIGRYPAMRDGGPSWHGLMSDTNPPDTESEWYKFFEEKDHQEAIDAYNAVLQQAQPGAPLLTPETYCRCFKQPSGLSPSAENLSNLTLGYYQKLAIGKSDEWIKVYIHGQYGFTLDGKAVFPEYSEALHCPEPIPGKPDPRPRALREVQMIRSFDFGITPACVWSQITPAGHWNVIDEMTSDSMGFDEFSDQVLEHSERAYPDHKGSDWLDVGDPAGQQRAQTDTKTCFQIGRAKGMDIQPAPQTLRLRLEGTRKPLRTIVGGRPQFRVHPRCKRLRKALMGGYHYRRVKVSGERYVDVPEKNSFSHVADACTYAGAWLFGNSLRFGSDTLPAMAMEPPDPTRSQLTGY
jgi:hypothetical protein